jgi:hypothetical protein
MHHIFCPSKRDYIVSSVTDRPGMRGVYLFGRPGRVVVEGPDMSAVQYARKVKQLRWQKCHIAYAGEYSLRIKSSCNSDYSAGASEEEEEKEPLSRVSKETHQSSRGIYFLPSSGMVEVATDAELAALLNRCGLGDVYAALSSSWGGHSGELRKMQPPTPSA